MDKTACSQSMWVFNDDGMLIHPAPREVSHINDMPPEWQVLFHQLRNRCKKKLPTGSVDGDHLVIGNHSLVVLWDTLPTEIKNEIAQLRSTAAELNIIFSNSTDGLGITDEYGTILRANKNYARIIGLPEEKFIGKTVYELVDKGIFSYSSTIISIKLKKQVTSNQFYHISSKWTTNTSTPIFNSDGMLSKVVTNVRDMENVQSLRDQLTESKRIMDGYSKIANKLNSDRSSEYFVSRSALIDTLYKCAYNFAGVCAPVLITGDSGVGKEIFADFIHSNSMRSHKPFLKINCGAIPEQLLEAELFGYEGGAFTGALRQGKIGLLELAHNGTVFLDEIGETSLTTQVKLLRFVQRKEFFRLGGSRMHRVNVRIIAATNRNLKDMMGKKLFREDFFYRLNVLSLNLPTLQERAEDIVPMAAYFLKRFNEQYGRKKHLSPATCSILADYHWPGNIRELENLMESLSVMYTDDVVLPEHLPKHIALNVKASGTGNFQNYREALNEFEKKFWSKVMLRYKSCRQAAGDLQVSHSTIVKKMSRYKLRFIGPGNETISHTASSA